MPKGEPYFGDMCQPKRLGCFLISMTLELFVVFITGILFFFYDNMEEDNTPWYIWSGAYFKMDHVTPNLWTTSISYGFLMLNGKEITAIKIVTVVSHWLLLWSLFSNLRVNLTNLPWTLYTMGMYRMNRYACILLVVVFQVIGQTKGIANVAYFVTYLGFNTGLLSLVHFEGYLPTKAKRKEALAALEEVVDDDYTITPKHSTNKSEMMVPLMVNTSD